MTLLLRWLQRFEAGLQPDAIVDVEHGLIIRVSRRTSDLLKSLGLTGLPLVAGLVVVTGLSVPTPWTPSWGTDVFTGYLLWLLGAFVHLVLDAVKRGRSDPHGVISSERWGLWLEAKDTEIFISTLTLAVTYLLFAYFERQSLESRRSGNGIRHGLRLGQRRGRPLEALRQGD
jgi:hypothetical protein